MKSVKTLFVLIFVFAFACAVFAQGRVKSTAGLKQDSRVIVNPYKAAPLTAVYTAKGNILENIEVTVAAKEGGVPLSYKVGKSAIMTHDGVPIFGLYPDYVSTVILKGKENGKAFIKELQIYAGPVNFMVLGEGQTKMLPDVEPVVVHPDFKDRLYLMNHMVRIPGKTALFKSTSQGGALEWDWEAQIWVTDTAGDVRWYLDSTVMHDSTRVDGVGAMMGFHQTKDGKIIWVMGQSYLKYDLMGRQIWKRPLPRKFVDATHEIIDTPRGYMIRAAAAEYLRNDGKLVRTIRDQIVEVNEDGDVLDYWDLNTILDPYRDNLLLAMDQGAVCLNVDEAKKGVTLNKEDLEDSSMPFGDVAGVGPGRNWAHVNSIAYDAKDDSIVISARHQGNFKIGRDKKVKWILASPEGWTGELAKKVLTPVDSRGKALKCENSKCEDTDFDWPWTQHTTWLTPKGTVVSFDNGDARGMEQPLFETDKYSRGVEYKIDEKKMTVQQIWEYGKDRGFDWYSAITSVADYSKKGKHETMFLYSASANLYNQYTKNILNEVKYGTQDVLVELHVNSNQKGNIGYRATILEPGLAFGK